MINAGQAGEIRIGGELAVHRLGYGAMRITGQGIWGAHADPARCLEALHRLPDLGVNFVDTADSYGPAISEPLLREALHPYGDIAIATKGGLLRTGPDVWVPCARPDYLLQEVKMSLRWLGLEQLPLWQLHRVDRSVPLDEQFGAIRKMLDDGLIRFAGLSEVGVEDIKAAREIFPVASVQNRYSLTVREHEAVLEYCEQEGIAFIPWAPLSRGDLAKAGATLEKIAKAHKASVMQIGLAWLLKRSPVMLPIPGSSRAEHVEENVAAAGIQLTDEDCRTLDALG